ncbi:MAG: adenosylcobinamide-phosphate synthase CbiB [Pseudomonadota bacterium]|nr:adenosylcobinamide-phosphate synthase CbiB [Pseudomonadota bacterium]
MPIVVIKILIALGLDQILGEPTRFHPLVGFGRLATALETRCNRPDSPARTRARGLCAWLVAVLPLPLLVAIVSHGLGTSWWAWALDIGLLYLCIGRKSLAEHGLRVFQALRGENLEQARHHTSMIVSRDTGPLDAAGCTRATVESLLENGNDSIYGALFWFLLFGGAGAVLYRLANTLDAMWGYRNERYLHFGWAAAKLDDLLNYLPARLCALCYALAGDRQRAWRSWHQESASLSSPNGGPVMCSGAGALNVKLGGPAHYHGRLLQKPYFGGEDTSQPRHIPAALQLLDRSLIILLAALWLAWLVLPSGWLL